LNFLHCGHSIALALDAGSEHIALASRAGGMDAKELAGFRKGRVFGKYRFEPSDMIQSARSWISPHIGYSLFVRAGSSPRSLHGL
jgi:hypothetical protein